MQIDLKHKAQNKTSSDKVDVGIDLREFYPSVEWDILSVPAERHEKYYPCCQEPYPGRYIFGKIIYLHILTILRGGLLTGCACTLQIFSSISRYAAKPSSTL